MFQTNSIMFSLFTLCKKMKWLHPKGKTQAVLWSALTISSKDSLHTVFVIIRNHHYISKVLDSLPLLPPPASPLLWWCHSFWHLLPLSPLFCHCLTVCRQFLSLPLPLLLQRMGLPVLPHSHPSIPLWRDEGERGAAWLINVTMILKLSPDKLGPFGSLLCADHLKF